MGLLGPCVPPQFPGLAWTGRLMEAGKLWSPQTVGRVGLCTRGGGKAQDGLLLEVPGPLDLLSVCA